MVKFFDIQSPDQTPEKQTDPKPSEEIKTEEVPVSKEEDALLRKAAEVPRVAVAEPATEENSNASAIPEPTQVESKPRPVMPAIKSTLPNNSRQTIITSVLVVILIVLLGLLVSQAVIFYRQSQNNSSSIPPSPSPTSPSPTQSASPSASPSSSPSASASPNPSASPSAASLTAQTAKVRVLNGGGATGAAAKAAATLKTAGFDVIATGNASSFTYNTTEVIYGNSQSQSVANQIVSALSGYTVSAVLNASIIPSGTDIVVIIGKQ